jgi:osmotically-inducible protein OsmY
MMTNTEWKQLRDLVEELDKDAGWTEERNAAAQENSDVASSVRDFLERKEHVPPGEAHIVSKNGQVELSGEVSWLRRFPEAEEAILQLPGVSSVTNHLSVRPYESANDLKSRVVEALEGRAHRIASRIRIERNGGVVTLRGVASSAKYRDLAGQVAACAPGVERVENLIEVDPPS